MPEFSDVVRTQRACRAFAPDDVDDGTIEQLLTAATFAPSAENRQPWVFIVVRDGPTRAAIGDLTRRAWRGGARAFSEEELFHLFEQPFYRLLCLTQQLSFHRFVRFHSESVLSRYI